MTDHPEPSSNPERSDPRGSQRVLANGRKVILASLADRLLARMFDSVIWCLFGLAAGAIWLAGATSQIMCPSCPWGEEIVHEALRKTSLIASLVVFTALLAYEASAVRKTGQTRGKRRLDIVRVVNRADGEVPSLNAPFVRSLVPAAAGAAGSVGATMAGLRIPAVVGLAAWLVVYSSALWGKDRRGWHDMAAGTIVVRNPAPLTQPSKPEPDPGSGSG